MLRFVLSHLQLFMCMYVSSSHDLPPHIHWQDHLGEVVFVELPECGSSVSQGSSFGAVESVKATSDVNSPISGEVVEVNTKLTETPGLVISNLLFFFFIIQSNRSV